MRWACRENRVAADWFLRTQQKASRSRVEDSSRECRVISITIRALKDEPVTEDAPAYLDDVIVSGSDLKQGERLAACR